MSRIVVSSLLVLVLVVAGGCSWFEKKPPAQPNPPAEPTTSAPPITESGPITTPMPGPIATPSPAGTSGARTYTVKQGDSLIKIAREQLGSEHRLNDLKKANPELTPPYSLKIGQTIKLPN